ncbi:ROK family protein [Salinarchaeum sp. Harcht-Bsk1]|uniref:ROK family protein n=1 Tax=Salinarchaeum sp. Harcht-Bsk1 TaxID=1333523 RepID=UPI000342484F|nr:ROK family protein [Salinarchaeum sp. Harcht-Bsk1]AGN02767.1 ROK family protein [Salinarchaeum sp. Harcht-Bsk1]
MTRVAVFGIGSTNFRYAVATPTGEFVTEPVVEPTRPESLAEQVVDAVDDVQTSGPGRIDAVAVSAPGLIDRDAGTIRKLDAPDGRTVPEIHVRRAVRDAHDLPVYVENDCNASVLAEWHFGSAPAIDSVAHLTIGTGIGGGVVERGRLIAGEDAQAGEFGLFSVAPAGDLESTGVTGAWEAYCSGREIPRFVSHILEHEDVTGGSYTADSKLAASLESGEEITAQTVFTHAKDGDAFAESCLERIHRYNAVGVAGICNAFNPGLLTIGGGVALNNDDAIIDGIERYIDEYLFVDRPEIRITVLGDDIGLYGSLATYVARSEEPTGVPERQAIRSEMD